MLELAAFAFGQPLAIGCEDVVVDLAGLPRPLRIPRPLHQGGGELAVAVAQFGGRVVLGGGGRAGEQGESDRVELPHGGIVAPYPWSTPHAGPRTTTTLGMSCLRTAAVCAVSMVSSTAQHAVLAEVGEPLPHAMGQVLTAADYEGDGDLDLFTSAGVFVNEGGFFRRGPRWPANYVVTTGVRSMAIADANGDGRLDAFAVEAAGSAAGRRPLHRAPGRWHGVPAKRGSDR